MMETALWLAVASVLTCTDDVRAVLPPTDGSGESRAWLGTTGGLVAVDGDERRVIGTREGLPHGKVRALFRDGEALLVGTERGIAWVTETGGVRAVHATDAPVHAFARHDGDLFVGSHAGLFRLDGERLERVGAFGRVTALASTEVGLYVSTAGAHAHLVRGGRATRLWGARFAWDVVPDEGGALFATSSGLRRYRGMRLRPARSDRRLTIEVPVRDVRAVYQAEDFLVVGTWGAGELGVGGGTVASDPSG